MAWETITSPDDPALGELSRHLASLAGEVDQSGNWPETQLQWLGESGVHRWFLPAKYGGLEWNEADLMRGYIRLGASCMTTTFILTQRCAAMGRIAKCENEFAKEQLLPDLAEGSSFATVGISHLTTSRRHLAKPVLSAKETADGFILDGYSPWVTGAQHAQTIVIGATLEDGQQILLALPTTLPGVSAPPPAKLLALSASHTGSLECRGVEVGREWLIAGPAEQVMVGKSGLSTGGLQTSALAVGLASAAIEYLEDQCTNRRDLVEPTNSLRNEYAMIERDLLTLASGANICSSDEIRARANSLVLRATQAALAAAKGAGFVASHPAGRWCREALFFLVWSCPQPVMSANLCELAGLSD